MKLRITFVFFNISLSIQEREGERERESEIERERESNKQAAILVIMFEDLLNHVSPKSLVLACVAIFAVLKVTTNFVNKERRIRALGGHAARVKTFIPWGKSLAYQLP